nr:TonB family protein [Prevotella dentasini]
MKQKTIITLSVLLLTALAARAQAVQPDTVGTDASARAELSANPARKSFSGYDPMPSFPGDIREFIATHFRYPKGYDDCISGRIVVKFFIKPNGKCTKFTIVRSLDPRLDRAAIECLKKMPRWKWPVKAKGGVWFAVPVRIRM